MKIIRSQLLKQRSVIHGSSTRGFFSFSCNGRVNGENKVVKDRQYFCDSLESGSRVINLVLMEQVQGTNIKVVKEMDRGAGVLGPNSRIEKTDGVITNESGILLGVIAADCAPLLFYDPIFNAVGCAHAGWPGTLDLIGQKMIEKMMATFDSRPEKVIVYIGPSIGPCCYKMKEGGKRVKIFKERFGESVVDEKSGAINLWLANKLQLMSIGVKEENIEIAGVCTCCKKNRLGWAYRFASHYREGEKRRQSQLTVIGLLD